MKRSRHPEAYDYYINEGFSVEDVEELHEDLIIGGWEMSQVKNFMEATDEEIEEALEGDILDLPLNE